MRRTFGALALAALYAAIAVAPANAGHADLEAEAEARAGSEAVYALAGSCTAMQPESTTLKVASLRSGGYDAAAVMPEEAESFRMQATDLGSFLLLGSDGEFLSTRKGEVV